jgi:hypothetical protein
MLFELRAGSDAMSYAIYGKKAGWRERWSLQATAATQAEALAHVMTLHAQQTQTMVIPCTAIPAGLSV